MEYASYAHEIKNSLNTIYGIIQLIELDNGVCNNPDEIKKYLYMIKDSVNSIKDIDKNFEEFIKTGKHAIKYETINVAKVVNDIADEFSVVTPIKKYIKPARAYTDSSKLKQVLRNIISNSTKYGSTAIEIECYSINNSACIIVRDNGIGMDAKELQKIGTPFYRCKRKNIQGSGLGISIIKKIAKLLNWDISYNSELGVGTVVSITLHHILG